MAEHKEMKIPPGLEAAMKALGKHQFSWGKIFND
jgi:hypothetical protein